MNTKKRISERDGACLLLLICIADFFQCRLHHQPSDFHEQIIIAIIIASWILIYWHSVKERERKKTGEEVLGWRRPLFSPSG